MQTFPYCPDLRLKQGVMLREAKHFPYRKIATSISFRTIRLRVNTGIAHYKGAIQIHITAIDIFEILTLVEDYQNSNTGSICKIASEAILMAQLISYQNRRCTL